MSLSTVASVSTASLASTATATASATVTATTSATGTSLLALTTPFVPPPDCASLFSTTSVLSSLSYDKQVVITIGVTVSDPSDPRFTACQPPGWGDVAPESRFEFSPAVCPSGWTAYHLGGMIDKTVLTTGTATKHTTLTMNTAYCCASDYSLNGLGITLSLDNIAPDNCVAQMGVKTTSDQYGYYIDPYPASIRVHNAYKISYQAHDRKTLSPEPPDMVTCGAVLETWVPGTEANIGNLSCTDGEHSRPGDTALTAFVIIGLPILLGGGACVCCGLCFYYHRENRREERKKARRLRSQEAEAGAGAEAAVAVAAAEAAARNDESTLG